MSGRTKVIFSNPIVLMGTLMFFCWYYPIGAYQNGIATNAVTLRGAQVWLFLEEFLLFSSTFAILIVAGMDSAATASNVASLMFGMCLTFCGCVPRNDKSGEHAERATEFSFLDHRCPAFGNSCGAALLSLTW